MRDEIQTILNGITEQFNDKRTQICELSIETLDKANLTLAGRVLDQDTLERALSTLKEHHPCLSIDPQPVSVLRKADNLLLTVGTNLTSVHDAPSFGAEQLSQMIFGDRMAVLETREKWVFVRQSDGYLGWTYLPYLRERPAPTPTHVVLAPTIALHDAPLRASEVVARIQAGTGVRLETVEGDWAQVTAHQVGWLPMSILRAIEDLPQTPEERRALLSSDAIRMIGTPYLWGGTTGNGIDCSGFARLVHKWIGLDIPRDADMQGAAGSRVQPPYQMGDLLFFGDGGTKITHVAISLGGWRIIHSSRRRNGVAFDDVLEVDSLMENFHYAATFING